MPTSPARRAPRAITLLLATVILALAIAAPGIARPAGHGPARDCVGCARLSAGVPTSSLAGTTSSTPVPGEIQTSSLAGTTSRTPVPAPAAPAVSAVEPRAIDEGGATTLALILIAAAALVAGAGAGFAGGRRTAARA